MSGIIKKYRNYLPVTEQTPLLTLHEGDTPLIYAENLSKMLDVHLYLKYEGMNPTGSFKDRGMVMAVAKALEEGSEAIICASTGNTSASAAAYAAKARLKCYVLIPEGKVALGKLLQAIAYGAEIIMVRGNFDQALAFVREVVDKEPITLVNSLNPYRLEGQKTAAFEIVDVLGKAPDIVALPVGNAGNLTAYWKGFTEYYRAGKCATLPHMYGFQAEGAAPLVKGEPIANPETVATAIRIGNPVNGERCIQAIHESDGRIAAVSDAEILQSYQLLAKMEGIFVEPASSAPLAGIIKMKNEGQLKPGETIVLVLTGNGLKDPDTAQNEFQPALTYASNIHEVFEKIREGG